MNCLTLLSQNVRFVAEIKQTSEFNAGDIQSRNFYKNLVQVDLHKKLARLSRFLVQENRRFSVPLLKLARNLPSLPYRFRSPCGEGGGPQSLQGATDIGVGT